MEVLDKGKNAVVVFGVTTDNEKGEPVVYNEFTNFIRGAGGFGGGLKNSRRKETAATMLHEAPTRKPDHIIREKTHMNQAALYRLSGDFNPLHIDPAVSTIAGFDKPILHGLCTLGYAVKHIFHAYCHDDPKMFKSVKARFVKHVFPGETLRTEMWTEKDRIIFQVYIEERNTLVISNAAVGLNLPDISIKTPKSSLFACSKFFEEIRGVMLSKSNEEREAQVKKVNAIFQLDIVNTDGEKQTWHIDLKNEHGDIGPGRPVSQPDLSISTDDKTLMEMIQGKLSGQMAFLSGKLKASGKLMLASQLDALLKEMRSSRL